MMFTCIAVIFCDNSTTPTDNTALLQIWGITEGKGRGGGQQRGLILVLARMIPHTVCERHSADGGGPQLSQWLDTDGQRGRLTNEGVSLWLEIKMQGWTTNRSFLGETWRCEKHSGPHHRDAVSWFLNLEVLLMVYVSWSFCRAEMSRGGGARPLHSFSSPSLKRRLRAGRGTPDSGGGWLRGFDTPLSRSEGWLPSCQYGVKGDRSEHQAEIRRTGKSQTIVWFRGHSTKHWILSNNDDRLYGYIITFWKIHFNSLSRVVVCLILASLHWLSVKSRVKYKTLLFAYKVFYNHTPIIS